MKKQKSNAASSEEVMDAVREYIFENHRFPQTNDIAKQLGMQRTRCKRVVDDLIRERKLYVVFQGPTMPKVVLPYDMMQGVLRTQSKPKWITAYEFKQKKELDRQTEELQKRTYDYEMFERLLYATDIPLQEAVAFALRWLDFANLKHHVDDPDNPDITFEYGGIKALVEVEGTTRAGDKRKVEQLAGWLKREIETGNKKLEELQGFLVVNHYRDKNPVERNDPLTPHAKEFLKLNSSRFFTTAFLLNIVKDVTGGLSKEEARKRVWEGEPFTQQATP